MHITLKKSFYNIDLGAWGKKNLEVYCNVEKRREDGKDIWIIGSHWVHVVLGNGVTSSMSGKDLIDKKWLSERFQDMLDEVKSIDKWEVRA